MCGQDRVKINTFLKTPDISGVFLIVCYNSIYIINIIFMEKYKKGFTLIELLVVISIISLLSAVVFVSLSSVKEKGNIASAQSIASSILKNIQICSQENNRGVNVPNNISQGGGIICNPSSDNAEWPSLVKNGYNYSALFDNDISDSIYTFSLIKQNSPTVVADLSTGSVKLSLIEREPPPPPPEEEVLFSVFLLPVVLAPRVEPIDLIKEISMLLSLSNEEAMEFILKAPILLKENLNEKDANNIIISIENAGGSAKITKNGEGVLLDVILSDAGEDPDSIVSILMKLGFSAEESKTLIRNVPVKIKGEMTRREADDLKISIEKAGGKADLK